MENLKNIAPIEDFNWDAYLKTIFYFNGKLKEHCSY